VRGLFIVLIFLGLGCWQVLILQSDYWIDVNEHFAIYNSPAKLGSAQLGFGGAGGGRQTVVPGVQEYALVGSGVIAGRSQTGLFVAQPDGKVSEYDSEDAWSRMCAGFGAATPIRLAAVSRFQDSSLRMLQAIWVACVLLLFGVLLWRRCKSTSLLRATQSCRTR